jgi:outer membrane protein assembly factor BamB
MSMMLVSTLEFLGKLYSDRDFVYLAGAEHAAVINDNVNYKIFKYDVGAYYVRNINGGISTYFGSEYDDYHSCYQLTGGERLVEAPELVQSVSEGIDFFNINGYIINVLKNDDYETHWEVINKATEEQITFNYDGYAVQQHDRLFVQEYDAIIALAEDLSARWSVKCESSYSTGFGRSRFFADNLLIYVSFREEPSSQSPWPGDTVNAVCLDTGKTLWSTTFDDPVMSLMHHSATSQSEAAIYIGTDKHCIVLDAETGKQQLKFASPYNVMDMKPIFLDDGSYQGELRSESRVWTDGHFIYFTGNSGGWSHYGADLLYIYRMDGSYFSGPIQIPSAYRFDAVKQCFHLNGKSYIPVSSVGQAFNLVDFGVIIIDPLTLTPESDIELEKGPVRELVHRVHDKKTESYQLKVIADESVDNARDDLIRFSEIETKRIAARFGDQRWTNKEKNRKFNGEIELIITGSEKMKLDCQEMLDILVERVHIWAVESDIDAGNRKDPIKVSWQWIEG